MPARNINNMYYENGSAARKILPKEELPRRKTNTAVRRPVSRKNEIKRQQEQRRKNASMVAFILCAFAMSVTIIYRYSQTVYSDTSESINKIQVNQETTFMEKIINYIKGIFL